jgi:hypothetical protein
MLGAGSLTNAALNGQAFVAPTADAPWLLSFTFEAALVFLERSPVVELYYQASIHAWDGTNGRVEGPSLYTSPRRAFPDELRTFLGPVEVTTEIYLTEPLQPGRWVVGGLQLLLAAVVCRHPRATLGGLCIAACSVRDGPDFLCWQHLRGGGHGRPAGQRRRLHTGLDHRQRGRSGRLRLGVGAAEGRCPRRSVGACAAPDARRGVCRPSGL